MECVCGMKIVGYLALAFILLHEGIGYAQDRINFVDAWWKCQSATQRRIKFLHSISCAELKGNSFVYFVPLRDNRFILYHYNLATKKRDNVLTTELGDLKRLGLWGTKILFLNSAQQISIVEKQEHAQTTNLLAIAGENLPSIINFMCHPTRPYCAVLDDFGGLHVYNIEGDVQKTFFSPAQAGLVATNYKAAWHPTKQYIAIRYNRFTCVHDIENDLSTAFDEFVDGPYFSPDGSWIWGTSQHSKLIHIASDFTGMVRRVYTDKDIGTGRLLGVGNRSYMVMATVGNPRLTLHALDTRQPQTQELQLLDKHQGLYNIWYSIDNRFLIMERELTQENEHSPCMITIYTPKL